MSSIITVTSNNNFLSLNSFLETLTRGSVTPGEVIIIDLTGNVKIGDDYNFITKVHRIHDCGGLSPIAVARNTGARKAWEEDLIFLDVNCIPNSNFIDTMEEQLLCASGLIMGEPRLLKRVDLNLSSDDDLFENSVYHPERPDLKKSLTPCFDPQVFWGMGFGMKKREFEEVGGFDENYKTMDNFIEMDFVHKVFQKKKDFYLSQNTYYHTSQWMPQSITPAESLIYDCNLFFKKWGVWPAQDTLQSYADNGLIKWTSNLKTEVELLDKPKSRSELINAYSTTEIVSHRA